MSLNESLNSRFEPFIPRMSQNSFIGVTYGKIQFNSPYAVNLDSADNVYVADTGNDRIQKFSPDGMLKSTTKRLKNKLLDSPSGIGIDSKLGEILVADSNNHLIKRFSLDLAYVDSFGTQGTQNGSFSFPFGVATCQTENSSGCLYVVDTGNNRIAEFQKILTNKYIFDIIFDIIQDSFN